MSSLQGEFDVLHLLVYRNRNQHGGSRWWKWLGMLHRHVRRVLRGERASREFIVRKLAPAAYREFMGVVQLGQFVGLGFALVGVLLRVVALLGPGREARAKEAAASPAVAGRGAAQADAVRSAGSATGAFAAALPAAGMPKAKKKKKAKHVMRDIFG